MKRRPVKRLVAIIVPRRRPKATPSISSGAPVSGGRWLLSDEEITGRSRDEIASRQNR